ncbi:MAG: hypothetical protein ABIP10_00665 [Ferruginibacter sp.]
MKVQLFIIFFLTTLLTGHPSKKDVLLDITKKYLPDNYSVLKNYDASTVDFLAREDSLQDYFLNYPTIIHEAFHVFGFTINSPFDNDSLYRYRLNDTLTIAVRKFKSIPSRQIDKSISIRDKKLLFAYDTYINSIDSNHVTQQNGFIGLLEEYTASFQSLKAYTVSYNFLRDSFGWNNPRIWIKYLSNSGSDTYSTNQFKLFISWYLQYCKTHNPDLYKRITGDKNIRSLYTHIETHSQELIKTFLINRIEILNRLKPFTIREDIYIKLKSDLSFGYGIDDHIKNLELTDSLLRKPEHTILNALRQ